MGRPEFTREELADFRDFSGDNVDLLASYALALLDRAEEAERERDDASRLAIEQADLRGETLERVRRKGLVHGMREMQKIIDKAESALAAEREARDADVGALGDLMAWVTGWDPQFIYDGEWPTTRSLVRARLAQHEEDRRE